MDLSWYLTLDGHAIWLPAVATLGIGVGFIAGMFGVGGGFLLIPLLHAVLGVPLPYAVGAGLCQIIATGLGGFLRYRKLGLAESRFDLLLLGGSMLGVDAGTRLLHRLDGMGVVEIAGRRFGTLPLTITAMYVALFFVMSWILWTRAAPGAEDEVIPGPLARVRIPPYTPLPMAGLPQVSGPFVSFIGFFNGVLAGMMGIGGGICLIPIMIYGYGFNIRKAAGTGTIIVLVVAIIGTIQHARLGNVHLGLVITLMTGAALAAQVGASLTRTLHANVLRKGLAVVMVITVAVLVSKLLG